jgi:hypothetical protein
MVVERRGRRCRYERLSVRRAGKCSTVVASSSPETILGRRWGRRRGREQDTGDHPSKSPALVVEASFDLSFRDKDVDCSGVLLVGAETTGYGLGSDDGHQTKVPGVVSSVDQRGPPFEACIAASILGGPLCRDLPIGRHPATSRRPPVPSR